VSLFLEDALDKLEVAILPIADLFHEGKSYQVHNEVISFLAVVSGNGKYMTVFFLVACLIVGSQNQRFFELK